MYSDDLQNNLLLIWHNPQPCGLLILYPKCYGLAFLNYQPENTKGNNQV